MAVDNPLPSKRSLAGAVKLTQISPLLAALACSWPIVTHAAEVVIPELGVRFPNLPAGVASPEVKARIDGYTATLNVGTATLRVDRMEEAVPSGGDIANAKFRATQAAGFYETPFSSAGHPTAISGHAAWTTTISDRNPNGNVFYTSRTYVVVDQHLYRFMASGWADVP